MIFNLAMISLLTTKIIVIKETDLENDISKVCQAIKNDESTCGRFLFDDRYCIFHSKDVENKRKIFDKEFWIDFERQKREEQEYDFSYFIFPNSISFEGITFDKCTYFNHAIFFGDANFNNTSFLCQYVFFNYVEFLGNNTSFVNASFLLKNDLWFMDAKFMGEKTIFSDATFSGDLTSFNSAKFLGKILLFDDVRFLASATDFEDSDFLNKTIWLYNSYFQNVEGLFETLKYKTKHLKRIKYKIIDFKFRLSDECALKYPIINKMVNDEWYLNDFREQYPFIYRVWNITSKCGRSVLRWAGWSMSIAIVFAIIYMLIGHDAFQTRHQTWFSFFYYSIVTFTTLGFGDITPIKWYTEILVTVEVILGYIMLGGLISIFSNKLSRRS